jgi:HAD superfamily hydrolase (TIGR01509 family)
MDFRTRENMRKPSVIVFDLGKVLVDFDFSIAARRIAAEGTLTAQAVKDYIDHSPLLFRYETGRLTRHEFYAEICKITGFRAGLDEFAKYFADIFAPIEPMIRWHARLREHGYPTYILSNTNDLAVEHIRRSYPFFANFNGYIYSYQVKAMKPQPEIYAALEAMAGATGDELVFIDDRPENVAAGVQRGWHGIVQENPDKTFGAAARIGLPV